MPVAEPVAANHAGQWLVAEAIASDISWMDASVLKLV